MLCASKTSTESCVILRCELQMLPKRFETLEAQGKKFVSDPLMDLGEKYYY